MEVKYYEDTDVVSFRFPPEQVDNAIALIYEANNKSSSLTDRSELDLVGILEYHQEKGEWVRLNFDTEYREFAISFVETYIQNLERYGGANAAATQDSIVLMQEILETLRSRRYLT